MMALSTQQLANLGSSVPDSISIDLHDIDDSLSIDHVTRYLRGRRLSGVGQFQHKPVFIKTFFDHQKAGKEYSREIANMRLLADRSIVSPRLQACGNIVGGGYWIAQQLLVDVKSFQDCWQTASAASQSELFSQMLELLGHMYSAGVYQQDAHLENFAISEGTLFVLDPDGIRTSDSQSILSDNLALLIAQFDWREHDKLIAMCVDDSVLPLSVSQEMLSDLVAKAWRKRLRKFGNKVLRQSSLISTFKSPQVYSWVVNRYLTEELSSILGSTDKLDGLIASGEILKRGNSATVARVSIAGRHCILKRYNVKNRWVALKRSVKPSRASNSWVAGHVLSMMNVSTSTPIAFAEEKVFGFTQRAYFLSEVVSGEDAGNYLADQSPSQTCLESFESLFEGMIYSRVSHGDMKSSNFKIFDDTVGVIDLDAVSLHSGGRSFDKAMLKDFARFLKNWPEGSAAAERFQALVDFVCERNHLT